ncbi:hypothetical protein FHR66_001342 [Xanthomonas sp. F4]|nr:hypothetical protein [Xanthomonas sp. 3307]
MDGIAAETKCGYDALCNLTKVTDPKGLDTVQQAIWLDGLSVGVLAKSALRYVQPDHLGTRAR